MPDHPTFVGPAYKARSPNLASDQLINLYLEMVESRTGKNVAGFYGTPGLRRTHTLPGSGGIRGLYRTSVNDRVFAVRGSTFYEIFAGGTFVARGVIGTDGGAVNMADNGAQLLLVDGTKGYILTLATNVFAEVTDPDFPAASHVTFVDGYFVLPIANTGRFTITGLNEGFTVDALDFATAEGRPDNLLGLIADHRELWLFGSRSVEVFFNSGDIDFPFDRIQGAFIEYGCGAGQSIAALDNTVYWLGSDERGQHMVFRASGYQPQRISTHAVEFAIGAYSAASRTNARAYTYQTEGHSWYVINFDEATWCYDVSTGLWSQKAFLQDDGTLTRHRANTYAAGLGENLVGDHADGRIYALDPDTFTDDGAEIPRIRTAPVLHFDMNYVYHHLFELDLEAGLGLDGGLEPGQTPQLMLRWSDDGGKTWSNEHRASAGALGHHNFRARWRRLGRSRGRVYEVRQSDPTRVVWINAKIEVTGGVS